MNVMRISGHAYMDGETTKVKAYKFYKRKAKDEWQGHIEKWESSERLVRLRVGERGEVQERRMDMKARKPKWQCVCCRKLLRYRERRKGGPRVRLHCTRR